MMKVDPQYQRHEDGGTHPIAIIEQGQGDHSKKKEEDERADEIVVSLKLDKSFAEGRLVAIVRQ